MKTQENKRGMAQVGARLEVGKFMCFAHAKGELL